MRSINGQLISVVVVLSLLLGVTSALKCFQCGEYHDGVGSITPCQNSTAHLTSAFLKDCPPNRQKYCIKYISDVSTVRDCVERCQQKEDWGSKTFCCNEDGCNSAPHLRISSLNLVLIIGLLTPLPSSFLRSLH